MSKMRSLRTLFLGLVLGTILAAPALGADSWTYDGITYRLPVGKESPVLPADVPEFHVVVPGDTLWDLSGHYLGDPFFWPLIWELNLEEVPNPHLIYPGQQLRLPAGAAGTVIPGTGGVPGGPGGTGYPGTGEPGAMTGTGMGMGEVEFEVEPEPEPMPAADRSSLIRAGYIADEKPMEPKIIDAEIDSFSLTVGDIVYLDTGSSDGVNPGDRFYVLDPSHKVHHPESGRNLGWLIKIPGILKVVCVQEAASTAMIVKAYDQVLRDMPVTPYYPIEMPMTFGPPELDDCEQGSREAEGIIVDSYLGGAELKDSTILGAGSLVYVDVGTRDGVVAGDYFSIWKRGLQGKSSFRFRAGELVLLRVEEQCSAAYITACRAPIFVGNAEIDLMK